MLGIENCDTEQSAFWEDDLPDGSTGAQYGPEVYQNKVTIHPVQSGFLP